MKIILFLVFSLSCLLCHAQEDYKKNFLKKWENAKSYTIEVAEAMPEELYDFKPDPEARSFKAQLLHMMDNMMWLSSDYLEGEKYTGDLKDANVSKEVILKMLNETFTLSQKAVLAFPIDRMDEIVKFFAGPMEIQQIMMLMTDHMTHHRGQTLVYLRMNQIKAPRYRGW